MSHKRWKLLQATPQALTPPVGVPPGAAGRLAAQLLANRGISGDIEAFLSCSASLAGDPFMLPEMGVAVTRLKWALRQEQPIAVYGDFDADGVTATVLLTEGLARLGAKVVPYIPHRFVEGYGLNQPALERLAAQGARLVVTADTGTTAHSEIAWAESQGLDILVTDHHTPAATLPSALATINPRRADSLYPFTELAGVGVALKLLQALGMDATAIHDVAAIHELRPRVAQGAAPPEGQGLDLVALGTVADMMPLLGENRYLVHQGLAALKRNPRVGLRCLMAGAGLEPGQVDTETISFCLAPRLNAAGRLDHAMRSYSLLTATQKPEAERSAAALDALNKERQRRTEQVCRRAQEILATEAGATDVTAIHELPLPLIMLGDPSFDSGVLGISANHLADQFYRPVVLFQQGAELCRGSARSIPGFNVLAALDQCRPWLLRYGGHPGAAGFTARPEHLSEIKQKLVEIAARELAGVELRPRLAIDAQVRLADLNGEILRFISRLAPYGPGNPPPTFLSGRVEVLEARPIGSNGKHLRLKLRETGRGIPMERGAPTGQGDVVWEGVAFNLTAYHELPVGLVDVVYTLGVNCWQGQEYLELRLLDFAPAGAVAA